MNNNDLQPLLDLPLGEDELPDDYGVAQQTQERELQKSTIEKWHVEALKYVNEFDAPIANWGEYEYVRTMAEFAYLKNEAIAKELMGRRAFSEWIAKSVVHEDGDRNLQHLSYGKSEFQITDGFGHKIASGFTPFEAWQNAKREGGL